MENHWFNISTITLWVCHNSLADVIIITKSWLPPPTWAAAAVISSPLTYPEPPFATVMLETTPPPFIVTEAVRLIPDPTVENVTSL